MRVQTAVALAIVVTCAGMITLTVQLMTLHHVAPEAPTGRSHGAHDTGTVLAAQHPDSDPFTHPVAVFDTSRRATVPASITVMTPLQQAVEEVVAANHALLADARTRGEASPATTVTLVSGVWDLGRAAMPVDAGWETQRRPLQYYLDAVARFLRQSEAKVLFVDPELYLAAVKPLIVNATARGAGPTRVVLLPVDAIVNGTNAVEDLDHVRRSVQWRALVGGAGSNSPTARLSGYAPLALSKLRLLRDAARWNPHHTDAFLWIDGAWWCEHDCLCEW